MKAKKKTPVHAVIVAAGSSKRMRANENKVFMLLRKRPVLYYSLCVFASADNVADITVVVREEDVEKAKTVIKSIRTDKPIKIALGGKERIDSVANGVENLCGGIVAVHDGARPLITDKVVTDAVNAAIINGASVAAVPPKDTVVTVSDDGTLENTPDRSRLMLAQTPQCFDTENFKEAIKQALQSENKARFTDDTGVYRAAGHDVVFSPGSYENIKITTPEDIAVAESIMKARKN